MFYAFFRICLSVCLSVIVCSLTCLVSALRANKLHIYLLRLHVLNIRWGRCRQGDIEDCIDDDGPVVILPTALALWRWRRRKRKRFSYYIDGEVRSERAHALLIAALWAGEAWLNSARPDVGRFNNSRRLWPTDQSKSRAYCYAELAVSSSLRRSLSSPVLISPPHRRMARLSRSEWVVKIYQESIPASGQCHPYRY